MDLQKILRSIQEHCATNRRRVTEFFQDFDKLRSGRISPYQFRRCLHMLGMVNLLSELDYELLFEHFRSANDRSMINYRAFSDAIDSAFVMKSLERTPTATFTMTVGGTKVHKPNLLSHEQWEKFAALMNFFIEETMVRGLILKEPFNDFDRHNNGRVTPAQFRRCFPFGLTEESMQIILRRYEDPATRDIDYLAWVREVEEAIAARQGSVQQRTESRPTEARRDFDTEGLIRELQRHVLTNRIKVEENFRDYDKLRSQLITEGQFASALGTLKFPKFSLTPAHIHMLQEHYRVEDDQGVPKIAYMQFCRDMDSVFTGLGLEKTPTRPWSPRPDLFVKEINHLSAEAEARLAIILDHIRSVVRTKRVQMKSFFKDFDRVTKGLYQTTLITRTRFERVLTLVDICLKPEEFKLICDKYQVKDAGNDSEYVRYLDFCADVDPEDAIRPLGFATINAWDGMTPQNYVPLGKTGKLTIQEVEEDIQTHCFTKRVRIHEFFRDFDPLRSGVVTRGQFASALTMCGIALSPAELQLLYAKYESPARPGGVKWLVFADAIDEVFTTKGLEYSPTRTLDTTQRILTKRVAELEPRAGPAVEDVLARLRQVVRAHGILLPPFFEDYDKHNTGRITASQFQQVLSRHHFGLTEEETAALLDCYREARSRHIDYRRFIRDIECLEITTLSGAYVPRSATLSPVARPFSPTAVAERFIAADVPPADIVELLQWIAIKVTKNAVRLKEFFVDADRLRKGFVSRAKFRTGLDMAGVQLDEIAYRTLEAEFDYPAVAGTINFVHFLKQINALEPFAAAAPPKVMPCPGPGPFPEPGWAGAGAGSWCCPTMLTPPNKSLGLTLVRPRPEADILQHVRQRIGTRRMNPKPFFQDFDRIRTERVTRTQFANVLDKLQLALAPEEVHVLGNAFMDPRGDIDYISFCNAVDPVR